MLFQKIFHAARVMRSQLREIHKDATRSSHWPTVRNKHLEENPLCSACGSHKRLQVHHIQPFHLNPELELDPSNLITLCMDTNECHLSIGHGDSFKAFNPNVKDDAAKFLKASSKDRKLIVESVKKNRLTDNDQSSSD